jgi:large subunit ribosomal protein L5
VEFLDRLMNVALLRCATRGVFRALRRPQQYARRARAESSSRVDRQGREDRGLNVSIVTTAKTDEEGLALLTGLGMPFRT